MPEIERIGDPAEEAERRRSSTIRPGDRPAPPEAMSAAAPSVGSSAARPGYGVVGPITRARRRRGRRPSQPRAGIATGAAGRASAATASSPPSGELPGRSATSRRPTGRRMPSPPAERERADESTAIRTAIARRDGAPGREHEQDRPEQIELLLHPERPEVEDRRRGDRRRSSRSPRARSGCSRATGWRPGASSADAAAVERREDELGREQRAASTTIAAGRIRRARRE